MLMRDVVEGQGGDIVGLACLDELVVLEDVMLLGVVTVGLLLEDSPGFCSVREICQVEGLQG